MKKILKGIIFTAFMILLCGCDIKYSVEITDGFEVNDRVEVDFPTMYAGMYYQKPDEYIRNMYDAKSSEFGISGYKLESEIGDDLSKAILTSTNSFENYFSNSPLKMMYEHISVEKKGGDTVIKLTGMRDIFGVVENLDEYFRIESFDVAFRSDYYMKDANYTSRNELTGEYVWHFERGELAKTMEFTLTDNKNYAAIVLNYLDYAIIPIILLVFLIICYIIYVVFRRKINEVNSLK